MHKMLKDQKSLLEHFVYIYTVDHLKLLRLNSKFTLIKSKNSPE